MIYVDASVVIAEIGAESRTPPPDLWSEDLISSRLLEYETLVRLSAQGRAESHADIARDLLARVSMIELVEPVLERVREPFPVPMRTLDALHLASMLFLREQGTEPRLASYDARLELAAQAMGFGAYPL